MQALGLIETKGLIAAIESADAMLKAADVKLLEKVYVGGGLVSIVVTGDVGAVKAAVEAGAAAVNMINSALLVSQHIIPRPHEELNSTIISAEPLYEIMEVDSDENQEEVLIEVFEDDIVNATDEIKNVEVNEDNTIEKSDANDEIPQEKDNLSEIDLNKLKNKKAVDKIVLEYGLEKTIEVLSKFKVVELRNLARKYKNFGIKGRAISKADKNLLLKEFREYYLYNQ